MLLIGSLNWTPANDSEPAGNHPQGCDRPSYQLGKVHSVLRYVDDQLFADSQQLANSGTPARYCTWSDAVREELARFRRLWL